jgi:hypothetical protein
LPHPELDRVLPSLPIKGGFFIDCTATKRVAQCLQVSTFPIALSSLKTFLIFLFFQWLALNIAAWHEHSPMHASKGLGRCALSAMILLLPSQA